MRYANQKLSLRAYWDRIEIYNGLKVIANHPCCYYEREQEVLDLDHYLELLFKKPGALDRAKASVRPASVYTNILLTQFESRFLSAPHLAYFHLTKQE